MTWVKTLKTKYMKELIKSYQELNELIRKVINFKGMHEMPIVIRLEEKWRVEHDLLTIQNNEVSEDEIDDECNYRWIISSKSMKGKELYSGIYDEYTILMAYPEDERWNETSILIFKTENFIY